jgi:hypothetical protein
VVDKLALGQVFSEYLFPLRAAVAQSIYRLAMGRTTGRLELESQYGKNV